MRERNARRAGEQVPRGEWLSLLIHDLRNPLTGVLSMLQVLTDHAGDPAVAEDATAALQSALRLQAALDDLLDAHLLERGTLPLNPSSGDARDLVARAARANSPQANARGITLEVEPAQPIGARFDERLLERAVGNLVANAVAYARSGEAVVVSARPGHTGIEIDVRDHGKSLSDAVKSRLFEWRDSPDDESSGSIRRGFACGLYFARLVAEAHGGSVAALDASGGGTVLRLRIAGA